MMSMVERVARALAKADATSDYKDLARAAIYEMRVPTDAMIDARFAVLGQGGKVAWEAMIDAALNEQVAG